MLLWLKSFLFRHLWNDVTGFHSSLFSVANIGAFAPKWRIWISGGAFFKKWKKHDFEQILGEIYLKCVKFWEKLNWNNIFLYYFLNLILAAYFDINLVAHFSLKSGAFGSLVAHFAKIVALFSINLVAHLAFLVALLKSKCLAALSLLVSLLGSTSRSFLIFNTKPAAIDPKTCQT